MMDEANSETRAEDGELSLLRTLPLHDLTPAAVKRVRNRAHAALRQTQRAELTSVRWARVAYRRAEPALVGAVAAIYLLLAFRAVLPQ